MKKKTQVIMLPTDKIVTEYRPGYFKNVLNLNNSKYDKSLELFKAIDGIHVPNPQYLYIISDEEIKEGDITINTFNNSNSIFKITKVFTDGYEGQKLDDKYCQYGLQKTLKKIIATTNSELWNTYPDGEILLTTKVGNILIDFIKHYIKSYNEGNIIKEVYVKYEEYHGINTSIAEIKAVSDKRNNVKSEWKGNLLDFKLKLSSNGCVIISNVEKDIAYEYAVWCMGREIPIEFKAIELFFNRFLNETKCIQQ